LRVKQREDSEGRPKKLRKNRRLYLTFLLALKRGGEAIDDPLSWMTTLSRETLDYWEAFWQISPFGEEWKQTAQLSYWIWRGLEMEIKPPNPQPTEETFMPDGFIPKKSLPSWLSGTGITDPLAQQQALRAHLGI
jgi:hypothetical protein